MSYNCKILVKEQGNIKFKKNAELKQRFNFLATKL